jgi:hypothetical protein
MKQLRMIALSAAVLLLATAGSTFAKDNENQGGTGAVRDLPVFTEVSLEGSMDLIVTSGEDQRVEIIAEPEMLEYIRTRVVRGQLRIWTKRRGRIFNRHGKIELRISMADLQGIEINGSGDARASGIDTDKFSLEINGSGEADLQGKCRSVSFEINGSGDIEARELKCVDASVEINGSGDAKISASGKLTAEINGSGDILAIGGPRINRFSSSGSGSIRTEE